MDIIYDYSLTPDNRMLSIINGKGDVITTSDTYLVSSFLKSLPSESYLDWYLTQWWRVLYEA